MSFPPLIEFFGTYRMLKILIQSDVGTSYLSKILLLYIYIFIAIALDGSIFLDVLHFPMKNIKSRGLEATPMGRLTSKLIQ